MLLSGFFCSRVGNSTYFRSVQSYNLSVSASGRVHPAGKTDTLSVADWWFSGQTELVINPSIKTSTHHVWIHPIKWSQFDFQWFKYLGIAEASALQRLIKNLPIGSYSCSVLWAKASSSSRHGVSNLVYNWLFCEHFSLVMIVSLTAWRKSVQSRAKPSKDNAI